jgi:hypothetical protein
LEVAGDNEEIMSESIEGEVVVIGRALKPQRAALMEEVCKSAD